MTSSSLLKYVYVIFNPHTGAIPPVFHDYNNAVKWCNSHLPDDVANPVWVPDLPHTADDSYLTVLWPAGATSPERRTQFIVSKVEII